MNILTDGSSPGHGERLEKIWIFREAHHFARA
jgi:hypothetical protein